MRNKLRRRNHAEVREVQSRGVAQSDINLLPLHVESGSDNEAVSKKGSARLSDDTNDGGECRSTRAADRQVITNIYQLQTEESHTSKHGVCVMRTKQHTRAKTVCKEHRDQDRFNCLLTKSVSPRRECVHSFQSKLLSPKHWLKQRYEAITPAACTSQSDLSQLNCLEEIKRSNPTFPARRVFRFLQKKSGENKCNLLSPGEKRKRHSEVNVPGKDSKRRRQTVLAERSTCRPSETRVLSTEAVQGHSRLSRTQRLKRLRQGGGLCDTPQLTQKTESETEAISCGPNTAGNSDVLWTEKYSPWHSSEVIGNSSSVNKVHSWLKKWRRRADGYDRREEVERKRPHDDDGLWDCGDFQGEAGSEGETVEQLSNTLLITGPPGVGKTASVYACALELGFKVFEVNCSSQRSGRCVLAQLKEVTQSHLVEAPGKEALRPAYYNNYNPHIRSSKPDALPGKNTSKTTASTSKRKPVLHQGRSRRRRTPDPGVATLASFFKTTAEEPSLVASPPPENHQELCHLATRSAEAGRRDQRTAAMSLVLFEEVDVIFDDDVGFLSAIKTLMTTTKRPVVLTTSDQSFKERFESDVEEILFKTPSAVNVCSYLRLVCLAENARTQQHEVAGLLAECQGDFRRCLLQLHFLVKSSVSRRPQRTGPPRRAVLGGVDRPKDGEERVKCVPLPADTAEYPASVSCLNTLTKQNILQLLKCQSWAEPENELLTVLTESWRRHFPLLYSNLELLLPVPASIRGTTNCCPDKDPNAGTQIEQPPPASLPPIQQQGQQPGENVDLKTASSTTMRTCVRNGSRLSRRKGLLTLTDCSKSSPNGALKPPQTEGQLPLEGTHLGPQGSVDKTGDKGIEALTRRELEALTHFVDLMSYLDSTVANVEPHISGPCVSKDFFWTGAEVKDGLVDEMREEGGGGGERTWRQQERLLEIQAAVEGLGFHVYRGRLSAASSGAPTWSQEVRGMEWEEHMDRLSLPGSTQRLSSRGHQPSMAQRRFELSRAVLQNRGFSLLGSRRAVCLDYMSTLRSICHHQRRLQQHDRFQNYLRSIHLGLSNTTMQLLAEECME